MTEIMVGGFYQNGILRTLPHTNAGAPTSGTSGTQAGQAGVGSLLVDTTNAVLYQNTGTIASPNWAPVLVNSTADGITAGATQTQAGATQLTANNSNVTTNAAAGNGVRLPVSYAGADFTVSNATANALQVYGGGTDTINGVVTTTGVSIPANKNAEFFCFTAGALRMQLSA